LESLLFFIYFNSGVVYCGQVPDKGLTEPGVYYTRSAYAIRGRATLNRYLLDLPIYYREIGFAVLTLNISIISDISEKSRTFLAVPHVFGTNEF